MDKISVLFLLNHSDTPNIAVNSNQKTVIAIKNININEELLADYNHQDFRMDGDKFIFNKDKQNFDIKKYNA